MNREDEAEPQEMRAQSFAQECLIPKSVLNHAAQTNGIKWTNISPRSLAKLVADTHVEQRTVANAATEAGLITQESSEELKRFDISQELRELSQHALSALMNTWS